MIPIPEPHRKNFVDVEALSTSKRRTEYIPFFYYHMQPWKSKTPVGKEPKVGLMKIGRAKVILASLVIVGFVLRVIGIGYGLPNLYHRDEQYLIHLALGFGTGDFNPHSFLLPPLASYLVFLGYGLYYGYLFLTGSISAQFQFLNLYLKDPTSFLLIGRFILGVFFGTVSIPVIYFLGKKIWSKSVGLWAAFFLTFSTVHVRDSHYAYNDILLMLTIMVFYFFLFRLLENPQRSSFLAAAGFLGLAIGTKYNAGLLLIPTLLAFIPLYGKEGLPGIKKIVFFFALAFVAYFLVNPFSVLAYKEFFHSFSTQVSHEYPVGLFHHLKYSLYQGAGLGVLLLAAIGISLFFKLKPTWPQLIFLSGAIVWYGVNTFFSQKYARYSMPLLPFIYILAAVGLQGVFALRQKNVKRILVFFFMILLTFQAFKTVKLDYLMTQKDSRDLAVGWVEANVPDKAILAVFDHGPRFIQSKEQVLEKIRNLEKLQLKHQREDPNQIGQYKKSQMEVLLEKAEKSRKTFTLFILNNIKNKVSIGKPQEIPYYWEEINKRNIQYVVVDRSYLEIDGDAPFWRPLAAKSRSLHLISPYKDGKIEGRFDPHENTAISIHDLEIIHRSRLGNIIEIYER
jgi:hypothetical protein